ncbi:MAG: mycothione reductase [Acidimicrobiales bacterium]|nr:mycothione reductase [Acidimicrobiales bacterium]
MTDLTHPTPSANHFDLIIVGSGSGNSIPEVLAPWRIAMVERGIFGGTCLNVGCIPSKMFVLPADRALKAAESKLEITTSFSGVDWPALRDRIFGRIDSISAGGEEYRASGTEGLTLYRGTARFTADRSFTVAMNDGSPDAIISGDRVLLAAGSRPLLPEIEGMASVGVHTSDTIMRLDSLPKRLAILGAGYIAAEMGHVFSSFGSRVIMYARSGQILRSQDRDIATRFTEQFAQRIDLKLNNVPIRMERTPLGIEITGSDGEISVVDEVLVAIGRIPNSDLLDPGQGGIALTADGRVEVNEYQETSAPGVWAFGDISNPFQLKHVANAEAKVAFANLVASRSSGDQKRQMSYAAIPAAVFSNPQVASVGATEQELIDRGVQYFVGRRDYGGTAYGWALDDHASFAKVLLAPTGEILGAHVIGPQAASLIQPLIQAMTLGQTAHQIAREVMYIHPALTEVVENALLEGLNAIEVG